MEWTKKESSKKVTVEIDEHLLKQIIAEAESFHGGTLIDKDDFAHEVAQDIIDRYFSTEYFDVDTDWVADSVEKGKKEE